MEVGRGGKSAGDAMYPCSAGPAVNCVEQVVVYSIYYTTVL